MSPGYLFVSIQNPFFGDDTLAMIHDCWRASELIDLGCFRSIYLTYRTEQGYRVRRWVPHQSVVFKNRGAGAPAYERLAGQPTGAVALDDPHVSIASPARIICL